MLHVSQPGLRAALVATELAGLVMARYVVRLEPIARLDVDTLVALFGPVFQRFIVGPLPATQPEQPVTGLHRMNDRN